MREMFKFLKDEDGQGMVEYGLIIGLIAVVVIAALIVLGPQIADLFTEVSDRLDEADQNAANAGGGN